MDSETKMKQVIVEMITGEKVEGTMVNIDKEKKIITITNGKKMKANGVGEPELFESMEIEKKDISKVKLLLYDTEKDNNKKETQEVGGSINSIPEDKQKPVKDQLASQNGNCYDKSESFFDKLEGMNHPEAKQESMKYNDKNTETFNIQSNEEPKDNRSKEEVNDRSRGRGRGRGGRGGMNRGRGQRGNGNRRGNRRDFDNNMMMNNTQGQYPSKFNNSESTGVNRGRDGYYRGNNMNMRGGYNHYNNYSNYNNYNNNFNNPNYNNYNNNFGNYPNRGRGNFNYHHYNQPNPYHQQSNFNYSHYNFNNQQQQSAFEMQQAKNMNLQQIGIMTSNAVPNQKPLQPPLIQPQP